jgi:hypothetical protein
MLQDPTEVSTMPAIKRCHVPVAIKFVIDIATDIHKPGHDGQIFSAEEYKNRLVSTEMKIWQDNRAKE